MISTHIEQYIIEYKKQNPNFICKVYIKERKNKIINRYIKTIKGIYKDIIINRYSKINHFQKYDNFESKSYIILYINNKKTTITIPIDTIKTIQIIENLEK
jgi:hypothetical protein